MAVRDITSDERERIAQYLTLDVDQLYSLIADENAFYTPDGQRAAGRRQFDAIRGVLRQKLCDEWEACQKIERWDGKDVPTLVIAVADVVCAVALAGVPAILLASLIVKIGIRQLCGCHEERPS